MRIAVVGGGLAGALLAWRLRQRRNPVEVEMFLGRAPAPQDATDASGGLVRGFELDPAQALAAAHSLAELRGSARLREWAQFRPVGSVYVLPPGVHPGRSVAAVNSVLPGSAAVREVAELTTGYPFRGLP